MLYNTERDFTFHDIFNCFLQKITFDHFNSEIARSFIKNQNGCKSEDTAITKGILIMFIH